jgi:hypothetical protein
VTPLIGTGAAHSVVGTFPCIFSARVVALLSDYPAISAAAVREKSSPTS